MKAVGYQAIPFGANRRLVAAGAAVAKERNTIHGITEVDISKPRRLIEAHLQQTGERLSLTAYVVACLARALTAHPMLNSFRRGRRLIILNDVVISVLIEREINGERVPEPVGIRSAHTKTHRQIHQEVRAAQHHRSPHLGSLSGMGWIRFIPGFCLRWFIRRATRSLRMVARYGMVGVSAVGMHGNDALWFIPLGGATVAVTIGGIVARPMLSNGHVESREHLCLTISFDHDIVDGAPAARFIRTLAQLIESAELFLDGVTRPE